MSSLPLETIEAIKEYRNRVGCSLREARDAVLAGMQPPQSEIESLRSALSSAREEAKDADRVRAMLGEILDALCGVLKPNTPPGVLPSYADLPDLALAAREEARRLTEERNRKDVALRAANAAMNHMGDVLNEMDAVEPEDEEKTSAAFALVRIEIGEAMPGDEERARAALGSSPGDK